MLVADKLPVQAYHFPFPALARIEKQSDGYRVAFDEFAVGYLVAQRRPGRSSRYPAITAA
jgi:hypothetical protein